MSERETIEHCRELYYDDMVEYEYGDEEECEEDYDEEDEEDGGAE